MAVTVLFLGPLADLEGIENREYPAPLGWQELLGKVQPATADQLRNDRVNVACKGKVLLDKTQLHAEDGDEVALLPPVSGG